MSQNWKKIEELFHEAADLPPGDRSAFLIAACGGDQAVCREVEGLLAASDSGRKLPNPFITGVLEPGKRIDRFEIVATCGRGGGGTVYAARDTHTGRKVAIKVFPPSLSPEQRRRYLKEARAASVLHHPHIVEVEEAGNVEDRDYLVMEYVDGRTLSEVIPADGLPIGEALDRARMILEGLVAAHAAGIIHRDLKPSNVMVTVDGSIKLLDFGLAKMTDRNAGDRTAEAEEGDPETDSMSTTTGQIVGTDCYLSPEQARGEAVDARTDIFSFGALLYEMLTGTRPFARGSLAATLAAVLRDTPAPAREVRREIPRDVSRLIQRCLEKDRDQRFASVDVLWRALLRCIAGLNAPGNRAMGILRRRKVAVSGLIVLAALTAGTAVHEVRAASVRKARTETEPEIARLVELRRYNAADELVRGIEKTVPGDQAVRDFIRDYRIVTSVVTTPAGAEVAIKDYATPEQAWRVIGRAPLKNVVIPLGYLRWRVSAAGYRSREFAETGVFQAEIRFTMYPDNAGSQDMEAVPAGVTNEARPVKVPEFSLDRYEVTNRNYQEFVNAGGYQRRELWQQPFARDGETLTWEQAMAEFRDPTGRAGAAGWDLGRYPAGEGDLPVTGVSWYEAEAYARFAGKRLPTYVEWLRAARTEWLYSDTVMISNFSGKGLAPVGSSHALDRFGTYDLAGNCKEWLWNEWGAQRLTMGGAWDEVRYAASLMDAAGAWDRRANIGFRCARSAAPPSPAFLQPVKAPTVRNYAKEKPVNDEAFAAIRRVYDYDKTPLDARIEGTDDTNAYWRMEKISFNATYPGERVTAYLFLPRGATPPYQTVVYFASGLAYYEKSSEHLEMWFLDPLIRSGRAVLFPVLWEMYERKSKLKTTGAQRRYLLVTRDILDLRRSVDYLDGRPEIASDKLAIFGFSSGAAYAPIALAVEPRFRLAELAVAGLGPGPVPAEIDPFQFLARSRVPVLMMNGRYDTGFPGEQKNVALLNMFGAPAKDKKLVMIEAGHAMVGYPATTRESLEWLDRYLGSVPMPLIKQQ